MKRTITPSCKLRCGGLVFAPSASRKACLEKRGVRVLYGLRALQAYLERHPVHPFVVYDYAGALVDQGIPVVDAVYHQGVYVACPLKPLQTTRLRSLVLAGGDAVPLQLDDMVVLHEAGVRLVSEDAYAKATGHGKMSRGAGHRAKKK